MTSLQQPLDEIEQWRNEARQLSKSDKLGHVVVNALELMQSVLVSGFDSESLRLKTKALSIECANAMASDPNKEDKSRSLHYGVTSSFCAILKKLTQLTEDEHQKAATMLVEAELHEQEFHDTQDYATSPSREGTPSDMTAFLASIRAETEAKIRKESRLATLKNRENDADDSVLGDDMEEEQSLPGENGNGDTDEDDVVSTVPSDLLDEDYDPMTEDRAGLKLAKRKPGRPRKAEHLKRLEMKKRRASAPEKIMMMIEPKRKRSEQGAKGVEKPFTCGLCGNAFMTKSSVFRHIRSEHKAKPFKCSLCGDEFMHDKERREHMKDHE